MTDNTYSKFYGLTGCVGIGLGGYVLQAVLAAPKLDMSSTLVFSVCVIVFWIFSIISFFAAYAFKFGRVDEVFGTIDMATLMKAGKIVAEGGPVRPFRRFDSEKWNRVNDDEYIVFLLRWRPYVCDVKNFALKRLS